MGEMFRNSSTSTSTSYGLGPYDPLIHRSSRALTMATHIKLSHRITITFAAANSRVSDRLHAGAQTANQR
jgi:hypothetical protein